MRLSNIFAHCMVLGLAITNSTLASSGFESRETTIEAIHNDLFAGLVSCREVVSSFIARIEAYNPIINAIISLNPNALTIADSFDSAIAAGNVTGELFCIPILVKDNYDTIELHTTGGNLALAKNQPSADAPTVAALKKAGAIVLGKTNLHELALEGLSVSSLGGQTINPYDLTRTPGGSSGGSGAAVAANFAVFALGTDTVNSLRSPASANSLFSFRPTLGLISRAGVMPLSFTQDSVGAMARNLKDLAVALTVMASVGFDARDATTTRKPAEYADINYSRDVYGGSLQGLRIGVVQGFFNRTASAENNPVNRAMDETLSRIRSAGAIPVPMNDTIFSTSTLAAFDCQTAEWRELMDPYLQSTPGDKPTSLDALYNTANGTGEFLVLPAQYKFVNTALKSSTNNSLYMSNKLSIKEVTSTLQSTFAVNKLDAIMYPEQKNLVVKIGSETQAARNGILAALTGFPVVCIPIGFSAPSKDAPIGVPIGMDIMGLPWSESKLFNIAARITDLKHVRRMPSLANSSVEAKVYTRVPIITPDTGKIPKAYPIGVLQE